MMEPEGEVPDDSSSLQVEQNVAYLGPWVSEVTHAE